jgi:hypothetical protein
MMDIFIHLTVLFFRTKNDSKKKNELYISSNLSRSSYTMSLAESLMSLLAPRLHNSHATRNL